MLITLLCSMRRRIANFRRLLRAHRRAFWLKLDRRASRYSNAYTQLRCARKIAARILRKESKTRLKSSSLSHLDLLFVLSVKMWLAKCSRKNLELHLLRPRSVTP